MTRLCKTQIITGAFCYFIDSHRLALTSDITFLNGLSLVKQQEGCKFHTLHLL